LEKSTFRFRYTLPNLNGTVTLEKTSNQSQIFHYTHNMPKCVMTSPPTHKWVAIEANHSS